MKEYPVIFQGHNVLAIMEGRKTVTRRIGVDRWLKRKKGDRLWVRETWYDDICPRDDQWKEGIYYRADGIPEFEGGEAEIRWRPINAKRGYGWDKNPAVAVVRFRRISA